MRFRSLVVATACLLGPLTLGGSARAQYLLSPLPNANGAQVQIGRDFPFPASSGIFLGGMTPVNGGTMGTGPSNPGPIPDGPGPAFWPPLLIRRNPASMGSIMQGLSTPQGGAITLPPGVLANPVGSVPRAGVGVFPEIQIFLMLRTTIDYAWPDVTAVLAPGGGPGIPGTTVVLSGPGGGTITYHAGTKSFGGAAQFAMTPGPFAGTVKVPPAGTMGSKVPVLSAWFNFERKLPSSVFRALLLGASNPAGVAGPGRALSAPNLTTMFGAVPLAARQFGPTAVTPGGGYLYPAGTIPSMSIPWTMAPANLLNLVNPLTASKGFPWTTGFVTVSAPGGPGIGIPDIFYLSGRDSRVSGIGNISLVSGALSLRKLSGPNANRGWVTLTLPEPAATIGTTVALAMLGLCHAAARRAAPFSADRDAGSAAARSR